AHGDEPLLRELENEIEAGKKYREELRTAQACFGRSQMQEAEQILLRIASSKRPDAQALLEAVREARAASEEENFYNRGRENAIKLIQQQQFEQAADLLRNLLSLFPGDAILERDLQSIAMPQPAPITEAKVAPPAPVVAPVKPERTEPPKPAAAKPATST